MISINGFGALGYADSYGNTGPAEGTSLPSTELLLSQDWGATRPPTLPDPPRATRYISKAKPPASPMSLSPSEGVYGPPSPFPPPTRGGETLFGVVPLPAWLPRWAAYGILLAGGALVANQLLKHVGGRRVVRNPKGGGGRRARIVEGRDDDGDLVERAAKFRQDFHWGIRGRKVRRAKVSKAPKVATKLGELVNVTYKTKKRGEKAQFFVHEFGEEGGRRPTLAMDIENKKLHIVGGDYDVIADGIKD